MINIETFFKKRPTDYNWNYFWIVRVQDWTKTNPAIAVRPFKEHSIVSNVIDQDNFKRQKLNCRHLLMEFPLQFKKIVSVKVGCAF